MPHPVPRFVYFDLDDTLLDHRHAERCALADVCAELSDLFGDFAVEHVQEVYHTHNVVLWQQYAEGRLTKDALKRLRFERLLQALSLDAMEPEALSDHYLACYARHWTYVEGARAAFDAVAARYPVGILTNGFAEVQQAKLDRFPELRAAAQALVISEDVGYMKPHPRIFAHAAEVAGVPGEAILYVGDSYSSDVRGARGAGWQVAWFTAAATDEAEGVFSFQTWPALLDHLAQP